MSTRSHIIVSNPEYDEEVILYRHSDGYPTGALPDIMEGVKQVAKWGRLNDVEYCSARLLQIILNRTDAEMEAYWDKTDDNEESRERWRGIGFGISTNFHGDIEYYYKVLPSGTVEVYKGFGERESFKKIGECTLEDNAEKVAEEIEKSQQE